MAETDEPGAKKTRVRKPKDCNHAPWQIDHKFCPDCGRTPTVQEQILLTLAQHPPLKEADIGESEESHAKLHSKLTVIAERAKRAPRKRKAKEQPAA
jgi:hypothetical protein